MEDSAFPETAVCTIVMMFFTVDEESFSFFLNIFLSIVFQIAFPF